MADEQKIIIQPLHVPGAKKLVFDALITKFADNYKSTWSTQTVYGRMDPIGTFKNTQRTIDLAFTLAAFRGANIRKQNRDNFFKIATLTKWIYPSYTKSSVQGAAILKQPPMFRIKFMNLIQDATTGKGLGGYIDGLTIDPNWKESTLQLDGNKVYFTEVTIAFKFQVLHEHPVGWYGEGFANGLAKSFPYGGLPAQSKKSQKKTTSKKSPKAIRDAKSTKLTDPCSVYGAPGEEAKRKSCQASYKAMK